MTDIDDLDDGALTMPQFFAWLDADLQSNRDAGVRRMRELGLPEGEIAQMLEVITPMHTASRALVEQRVLVKVGAVALH